MISWFFSPSGILLGRVFLIHSSESMAPATRQPRLYKPKTLGSDWRSQNDRGVSGSLEIGSTLISWDIVCDGGQIKPGRRCVPHATCIRVAPRGSNGVTTFHVINPLKIMGKAWLAWMGLNLPACFFFFFLFFFSYFPSSLSCPVLSLQSLPSSTSPPVRRAGECCRCAPPSRPSWRCRGRVHFFRPR